MAKVWIRTPFSTEKNLGKAYNDEMAMIPEGDAACFIDGDVCFLTPDFGQILTNYTNDYPNAVLTCWTNRIHEMARGQKMQLTQPDNIRSCVEVAKNISDTNLSTTPIIGPVSGFLMVIPKSVWHQHKFVETNNYRPGEPNILGVDNEFTNKIRAAGIPILRINRMLVWHTYRLLDGSKKHLQ